MKGAFPLSVAAFVLGGLVFGGTDASSNRPTTTSRTTVTTHDGQMGSWNIDDALVDWTLSGSNPAVGDVSIPVTIPGNAHLALMAAGILDVDPFYR